LEFTVDGDEIYAGRERVTLHFELPRGCYATILLRRLAEEGGRGKAEGGKG
jgi:tRNA(Glu) U13 pseudouridine synthase TruD